MEFARAILSVRPDIPVVLCTGFSAGFTPERPQSLGVHAVLMKPISIQALSASVRKAIDSGQMPDR